MKYLLFLFFPISSLVLFVKGISMDLQTRWNPTEFIIFSIVLAILLIGLNIFIYKNIFSIDKIRKIIIPPVFFVEFLIIINFVFLSYIEIPIIAATLLYSVIFTIISVIISELLVFVIKKFYKK